MDFVILPCFVITPTYFYGISLYTEVYLPYLTAQAQMLMATQAFLSLCVRIQQPIEAQADASDWKHSKSLKKNIKPYSACTSRSFAHAGLPQLTLSLPLCSLGVQSCSLKSQAFDGSGAETEVGHGPLMIGDFPTANTPPSPLLFLWVT